MADIFRRNFTVYVRESDGSESVLFHLSTPDHDQLENADKLVSLALVTTGQAPPARMFFKNNSE